MNSALLSIGAVLLWSLLLSEPSQATQTQKGTDRSNVVATEITQTSCAVTGKGRTRALCENRSLPGSGTIAAEKSQYLSTVIITAVSGMLIVITLLVTGSLALVLLAAWARRVRHHQPVEKTGTNPSPSGQSRPRSQWAFRPTLWNTVGASWLGLAWLVGIFSLIWSIWFVWFI